MLVSVVEVLSLLELVSVVLVEERKTASAARACASTTGRGATRTSNPRNAMDVGGGRLFFSESSLDGDEKPHPGNPKRCRGRGKREYDVFVSE